MVDVIYSFLKLKAIAEFLKVPFVAFHFTNLTVTVGRKVDLTTRHGC